MNPKEDQKTALGSEYENPRKKIKNKRGRKALTRQYPLLFPRSSASHLTLKHNFECRKRKKGGGKKVRKMIVPKRKNVKTDASEVESMQQPTVLNHAAQNVQYKLC